MTEFDPLELLVGLDGPIEPRTAFSEALLVQCLNSLERRRRQWLPRRRNARALVVLAAFLIVAAVATATYVALRGRAAAQHRPATLTVLEGVSGIATVRAVGPDGRVRTIWQCPEHIFCGEPTSMAWSPNGRRLALTFGEISGSSGYPGLHVIEATTGADKHLGAPAIPHSERNQPRSVIARMVISEHRALGCPLPHEVAWAPDGNRLTYVCGDDLLDGGVRTTVYVINADGTGRRRIPTGTFAAYWPSFSPDGRHIAFATHPSARRLDPRGAEWIFRLHHRPRRFRSNARRTHASAPAWSLDGRTIAYESACGIRLATPRGLDVTPRRGGSRCLAGAIGRRPAWSPDGKLLAVEAAGGFVSIIRADGTGIELQTRETSVVEYGSGRPAWRLGRLSPAIPTRRPAPGP